MKPEEQSRLEIDQQLKAAGWIVQDRKELNIHAGNGVAVREFPLLTGEADYMLYADAKAIGVVEAKPVGHTLKGVELQSAKYLKGLPPNLPHYHLPLPFGYESTGKLTQFTNALDPHARGRSVFTFHTPAELIRLANLDDQVRARLQKMPRLDSGRLWPIQATSILNLERALPYTATQLDRDVVNKDQIRLVIKTFRDRLPEIFPGRIEVPKTLVFAKTDQHAEDIVEIIREEFARGNDFCQKITSKTTVAKPDELLQQFRNAFFPRIAVTVDMIATGTDVKPLECLLFMRNIRSLSYFEQMKGRGCRVVDPDALQIVTPDAQHKDHFAIVDCIGVCEEEKSITKPLDRKPFVPLDKVYHSAAAGMADPDIVSTLAARLARLERDIDADQEPEIKQAAATRQLRNADLELRAHP